MFPIQFFSTVKKYRLHEIFDNHNPNINDYQKSKDDFHKGSIYLR